MVDPWTPEAQAFVQGVREIALETLESIISNSIPADLTPSVQFLNSLAPGARSNVLKASLIIYVLSGCTMVPRELQLRAALAEIAGFDTSVMSGTGTGKTLIMAIPHILDPGRISFIISPLKRLQLSQANALNLACSVPELTRLVSLGQCVSTVGNQNSRCE
jgi:hypothetical protein